ncbi:uncharacterized protein [Palaemon carinicauda]|uniref:uncharacterized protein isoform X1 n=1 Tax=Palaemon carinicauda TaxID=392227 RepID=UPI0035B65B55
MYPYPNYNAQPNKSSSCLKTTIITLAIIGFIFWTSSLGASAGLCFEPYGLETSRFNGFLLVVVNAAYIFFTSEIVYLISYVVALTNEDLRKLRRATSKLLAAALIGCGINISAIIHVVSYGFVERWYIEFDHHYYHYYNHSSSQTAFICSFSYMWTIIIFICTAVFYKRSHTMMMFGGVASTQGNMQVSTVAAPGMPAPMMNPAYAYSRENVSGMNLPPNMSPQNRHSYAPSDRIGPPIPPRV